MKKPISKNKGDPRRFKGRLPGGFGFEGTLLQFGGALVLLGAALFGYREIKRNQDDKDARSKVKRERELYPFERAGPPEAKAGEGADSLPGSGRTWQEEFRENHPFPRRHLPPLLRSLFGGIPPGYEDAALFELLSMLGALCFSKVRAVYLDGKKHAANLLVVVEGSWGAGKSKLKTLYETLFEKLIEREKLKNLLEKSTATTKAKHIVQNLGISVTKARLNEILAENGEVHVLFFDEELEAVVRAMKDKDSISSEHIRKAFDNGTVSQNNMSKNAVSGSFRVYANMVFTGTPSDVTKFTRNELSGGTVSRVIWSSIPENGMRPSILNLPDETVKKFIDNIEVWNRTYCYSTDSEGNDVPCAEYEIMLPEVNRALDNWSNKQYQRSLDENNPARRDVRTRSAAIAFHCAIVLAMLYDYPDNPDKKSKDAVVDLTLYLADYIQERFLHKFGSEHNVQRALEREAESVKPIDHQDTSSEKPKSKKSSINMAALKAEHDSGVGWNKLGEKYGCTGTYIKKLVKKYETDLLGGSDPSNL